MWHMDCEIGKVPRGWKEEPDTGYIAVSDEVRALHETHADYIWDGVTLVAPPVYVPPVPTLAEVKTAKELNIRMNGSSLMLQIVAPYSAEERDTWPSQVVEAKAYTDNPLTSTPMLTALCAQRGNTVADQAARILDNEAAFKTAVGAILGIQQAKIDLIAAATTVEEVNAITWGV